MWSTRVGTPAGRVAELTCQLKSRMMMVLAGTASWLPGRGQMRSSQWQAHEGGRLAVRVQEARVRVHLWRHAWVGVLGGPAGEAPKVCCTQPVMKVFGFRAHLASRSGLPQCGVRRTLGRADAPLYLCRRRGAHVAQQLWQACRGGAEGHARDADTTGDEAVGQRQHLGVRRLLGGCIE